MLTPCQYTRWTRVNTHPTSPRHVCVGVGATHNRCIAHPTHQTITIGTSVKGVHKDRPIHVSTEQLGVIDTCGDGENWVLVGVQCLRLVGL